MQVSFIHNKSNSKTLRVGGIFMVHTKPNELKYVTPLYCDIKQLTTTSTEEDKK